MDSANVTDLRTHEAPDGPAPPTVVSALQDPAEANKAVAEILAPPGTTLIDLPPDGSVNLPGGYIDPQGELHIEAEVRELTGADEEALGKPEVMKSLARFTQTLLVRGVTRIGPYEKPGSSVLGALLIGDRDALLLAIRCATYGHKLDMSVNCPACSESLDVDYDLTKDVPVRSMDDRRERIITMDLRNGRQVRLSLAVGSDQEAVLAAGQHKTVAEMNTLLLSRCVSELDGTPLGTEGVRALGIKDRRNLLEEITARQPGPKYNEIDMECPTCARKFPLAVDLGDLFR